MQRHWRGGWLERWLWDLPLSNKEAGSSSNTVQQKGVSRQSDKTQVPDLLIVLQGHLVLACWDYTASGPNLMRNWVLQFDLAEWQRQIGRGSL